MTHCVKNETDSCSPYLMFMSHAFNLVQHESLWKIYIYNSSL